MDSNLILSVAVFMAGIYGVLSFYPSAGRYLFPSVYTDESGNTARRYAILFTGLFCSLVGTYSLFFEPLFN